MKPKKIIDQMLDIAYGEQQDRSKPVLVGLAAPQIGISKRIVLVDVDAKGKGKVSELKAFINPKITNYSQDTEENYECCFSTDRVCGVVNRPKNVTVEYYDLQGKKHVEKFSGFAARIFQHEVDHLNGKGFVQHIKDDDKLHWVEPVEFPEYRENWHSWPKKCSREKWDKIKGNR